MQLELKHIEKVRVVSNLHLKISSGNLLTDTNCICATPISCAFGSYYIGELCQYVLSFSILYNQYFRFLHHLIVLPNSRYNNLFVIKQLYKVFI